MPARVSPDVSMKILNHAYLWILLPSSSSDMDDVLGLGGRARWGWLAEAVPAGATRLLLLDLRLLLGPRGTPIPLGETPRLLLLDLRLLLGPRGTPARRRWRRRRLLLFLLLLMVVVLLLLLLLLMMMMMMMMMLGRGARVGSAPDRHRCRAARSRKPKFALSRRRHAPSARQTPRARCTPRTRSRRAALPSQSRMAPPLP